MKSNNKKTREPKKDNQTFLGFYQPEADKNTELNEMFEIFWKEYPKKVAKAYTKKIFKRLRPTKGLFRNMILAITRQRSCDQWKRKKGQYIPNPSTWLSRGQWDDVMPHQETTAEMHARLKAKGEI